MTSRKSTAIGARKDRSALLTVGDEWNRSPSPVSDLRTMDLPNSAYMKLLQNALKAEMRLSETTRTPHHASKLDSAKLKLSKFDLKYSKQSSLRTTLMHDSDDDSYSEEYSVIRAPYGDKQNPRAPDEIRSEVKRVPESNAISKNIADAFHTSKDLSAINKENSDQSSPPLESLQQGSLPAKHTDIKNNTLALQKIEFLADETILATEIEENLSVSDSTIKTVATDTSFDLSNIHSIASLVESDKGVNSPGVTANGINSPDTEISSDGIEGKRRESNEISEATENKLYNLGKSPRSESQAGGSTETPRRDKSDSKSDNSPFNFSNIKTIEDLFDQQPVIHESSEDENNASKSSGEQAAHNNPGSPVHDLDILYEDTFSEEGTSSSIRGKGISPEGAAQAKSRNVEDKIIAKQSPVRFATFESVLELKEEPLPSLPTSGELSREIFRTSNGTPLAASRSPDKSSPLNTSREKRRSNQQKQQQRAETSEIKHASVAVQTLISCRMKSRGIQVAPSPSSASPSSGRSHSVPEIVCAAADEPNVPVLRTIRLPVSLRRKKRSVSKSEQDVELAGHTDVKTGSTPPAETGFCCPYERAMSDLVSQQLDLTQQLVQRQYRLYLANCRAVQLLENEYHEETPRTTEQSIRFHVKQNNKVGSGS